jgi:hypothetical protein
LSPPPRVRWRSLRRGTACPPPPARTRRARPPRARDPASPDRGRGSAVRCPPPPWQARGPSSCRPVCGRCSPREKQATRGPAHARAGRANDGLAATSRPRPRRRRGSRADRQRAMSPCAPWLSRRLSACRDETPARAPRTLPLRRRATTPPSSGPRRPRGFPRLPERSRRATSQPASVLSRARSSRLRDRWRLASTSLPRSPFSRFGCHGLRAGLESGPPTASTRRPR